MRRAVAVVTAILLISSVHIPSGEASSPSTKAKKVAADGHRQSSQSAQGSAPPISISPAKLVALPKANPLKSSSGTTTLPVTSSDILSQYSLPNGSYFTHMTFDRRNSVLYAGASNLILQLNYNLSVLSEGNANDIRQSVAFAHGRCVAKAPTDIPLFIQHFGYFSKNRAESRQSTVP